MLRLISLILFLGGIAAAALGAMVLMERSGVPRIGAAPVETAANPDEWPVDTAEMESDGVIAMEEFSDDLDEAGSMGSPGSAIAEMPMGTAAPQEMEAAPGYGYSESASPEPVMEMPPLSQSVEVAPPPPPPRRMATRSLTPPASAPAPDATSETMGGIESVTSSRTRSLSASAPQPVMTRTARLQAPPQKTASEVFLESLRTVPIAHETPKSAGYKQAFDVVLAIDATGDDDATDALPGRGNIVADVADVSDRVEARLSGAAFDIESTSPGVQILSPVTENTWRWSVSALSAGEHDLVFEIFAIDQDAATPLRTYRDTVTVEVTGITRAIAFADQSNPVFILLGGLGSALAGLFGVMQFFRKRA